MPAALFDLDGVIVDTEPSYSVFWGGMGNKYNVGIDDFANVIKGTTLTQILDRYFAPELHSQVVQQLEEYERSMNYELFPGVMDFLEALRQLDIPCAIVTSSNRDKMANLWRQHPDLRQMFDAVVTDEMVKHSKPDPEPYLIGAAQLDCDPCDSWVFEDSYNGLISGRRAGARVIALATTNPADTLTSYADLIIDSFVGFTPAQLPQDAHHPD